MGFNNTERESGYVTYRDYEQYMVNKIDRNCLEVSTPATRRIRHEIRDTLLLNDWRPSPNHPETRFYPPRDDHTVSLGSSASS